MVLKNPLIQVLSVLASPVYFVRSLSPKITVSFILFSYLVLGFTVLGFNRSPLQALATTLTTCLIELLFGRLFRKKWFFPSSALITSMSLTLLLNYSHNYWILVIPCFFAIGSKYLFTFNNRHIFNPAQASVSLSLIFVSSLITSSPSYQWHGIESMGVFIFVLGLFVLVPKVNRFPLVFSFLFFFTLQILYRTWLMKHHLPFETLFFGTITSPAFFIFTFFMITDPATSPKKYSHQIILGFFLAFIDMLFHLKQSYHTFFYAGFTIQSSRLIYLHVKEMYKTKTLFRYFNDRFLKSGYWFRPLVMTSLILFGSLSYSSFILPSLDISNLKIKFELVSPEKSGVDSKFGDVFERVDDRVQHIIKWLMSVGDSVAVGDFDNDGLQDLFFTNPLKKDADRNALYKNMGNFEFKRIKINVLAEISKNIEANGLPSNALFVDFDNDKDLDLFIVYAFGKPRLLINQLTETGSAEFVLAKGLNLPEYSNSIAATFFDANGDGRLDLFLASVWPNHLIDYENKTRLSLFNLPEEEYDGDVRMFNFMHKSWHMADNGGFNRLYFQNEDHSFTEILKEDSGLDESFWSLAVVSSDLNKDGLIDLYVANDFGPDRLYYNQGDFKFKSIKGEIFGDVGLDTYKGMNASIGDFDSNGWQDVYVSNVHHQLQAEGSLLWSFSENLENDSAPIIKDTATQSNALNEERFGWGASIFDMNNDGELDFVQANGMVDDKVDKKFDECPDYWYVNEKIARSAPSIHRYIHNWGDIRGYCIFGNELNRAYLNNGQGEFIDVASFIGLDEKRNSRGVASVDLNNDGLMDLVISNQHSEASIYKNKSELKNNWIALKLNSLAKECNSQAFGSKVKITYISKGEVMLRFKETTSVNGFSAQNDSRIHFGLGEESSLKRLEVNWCGKFKRVYDDLELNQYHDLTLTQSEI